MTLKEMLINSVQNSHEIKDAGKRKLNIEWDGLLCDSNVSSYQLHTHLLIDYFLWKTEGDYCDMHIMSPFSVGASCAMCWILIWKLFGFLLDGIVG